MSFTRRLAFILSYFRRPRWDSGVTPPELLAFLKGRPPGRAIDLGCGTGTNVITLAKLGWQVTGVDFVPSAIAQARRKAKQAGVRAALQVGDVTRLEGIRGPFDFALDLGCLHGLEPDEKAAYLRRLDEILTPGGYWLLYGFLAPHTPGLTEFDLERMQARFRLVSREEGEFRGRKSAYWLWQKPFAG
jgi:cyclopropane fatty-acyl-phospholipid synthase-like methyltransferase